MCFSKKENIRTKHLDGWLRIKDPKLYQKYREHRLTQFDMPFWIYIVLEVIFMAYRTYQTAIGAGDWDQTTLVKLDTPSDAERFWYAMYAFLGWSIIVVIYFFAKFKYKFLYNIICPLLILNLVLYQYLYMPFSLNLVREFCFWAVLLQFRCTIIVSFFQMNGIVDLLFQILFSVPVFVDHSLKLVQIENWIWLPAPVFITTIGCCMFNYITTQESSHLFLLERVSNQQNEEQLKMIDMLPGSVVIFDKDLEYIMFRNQKNLEIDFLTEAQNQVDENYKFKIVPFISLQAEKKDAIRLREHPEDKNESNNEGVPAESFSFTGIVREALNNDYALTCCRLDKEIYYAIKIQSIHFSGEDSYLIFLQDITALQMLREKETQDRLTTMYSANVSHEMRTPLSTCINFTDLLLASETIPTKHKHLEIIKFSAVMMLNNVNDNLDNAQIQRGTFIPRPLKCQLKTALIDVVKVIEMQAASKNIKIEQNVPRCYLNVDKQRVQQVTMNLLSNACKFTSDGIIKVEAWVCDVEETQRLQQKEEAQMREKNRLMKIQTDAEVYKGHYHRQTDKNQDEENPDQEGVQPVEKEQVNKARLYIQVTDSGCGMSDTDMLKLFKDFCSLKANAHLNPNGVGLGLSICKKICKNLDGDIYCTSQVGVGSKFTFYVSCDVLDELTGAIKQSANGNTSVICTNDISPAGYGNKKATPDQNHGSNDSSLPSQFSSLVNRMHQVFQQFKLQDSQNELLQNNEFDENMVHNLQANEMLNKSQDQKIGPKKLGDPTQKTRILCVDDQIFNIEFLRCQLELMPNLQGRCDYADNGLIAIKLVKKTIDKCRNQNPFHSYYSLILLDYSMPEMDGPTTARQILDLYKKEQEFWGRAPPRPHIVCLTAFTEKIFENTAREAGMNAFVSKPITNQKLKQILKEQRLISLAEQTMEM